MNKTKALIGMSGGVDSSVAAYLTQQEGFDCIGATMRLYDSVTDETVNSCCALEGVEDARSVAGRFAMPHYTFHFKEAFQKGKGWRRQLLCCCFTFRIPWNVARKQYGRGNNSLYHKICNVYVLDVPGILFVSCE